MKKAAVLNVLLADFEYSQYLLMKEALSVKQDIRARILWCGEVDQYQQAIQSDIYDLVFMEHNEANLFLLAHLKQECCQTPVVMMADEVNNKLIVNACKQGALDVLDRKQPDINMLGHYALYADMHRKGERHDESLIKKMIGEFTCEQSDVALTDDAI